MSLLLKEKIKIFGLIRNYRRNLTLFANYFVSINEFITNIKTLNNLSNI
jgi:hypothetical protein